MSNIVVLISSCVNLSLDFVRVLDKEKTLSGFLGEFSYGDGYDGWRA